MKLLLVNVFFVLAVAGAVKAQTEPRREKLWLDVPVLLVTGHGEVFAAPDRATIRVGATAQTEPAATAQDQINKIVTTAIDQIKALNIPADSIQTEGINLSPVYSGQARNQSEPRIIGYRATNTISIRVDDLKQVGPAIDAAVKSGANQVQGITFELKDDKPQKQEALRRAVAEAQGKAEAMAAAAKLKIDGVLELSESGAAPIRAMMTMARSAMMGESASTPVQPGQLKIEAVVNITYKISDAAK